MTLYKDCRLLYELIKFITNDFEKDRVDNLGWGVFFLFGAGIIGLFLQILEDFFDTW